jgi:hypothetical protein
MIVSDLCKLNTYFLYASFHTKKRSSNHWGLALAVQQTPGVRLERGGCNSGETKCALFGSYIGMAIARVVECIQFE